MNTEHSHPIIHPATIERSTSGMPKRSFAKSIVSNGRRLRQRIGVAVGLCLGLAALVIAFE